MNEEHLKIRNVIRMMSPRRAILYIKSFGLPEEEETLLIECDVYRKTYAGLYSKGYSSKTIKSAKQRAYTNIANELYHAEEIGD